VKYVILADIHSNLEAFEAVLNDAEKQRGGFEEVWCLGDIVGYGPDPSQCIRLLRSFEPLCICGNHDLATLGKINAEEFNEDAALANTWNAGQITDDDRKFLLELPQLREEGDFTLVHGSPGAPVWEYITSVYSAMDNFPQFDTRYCLVGHTHQPLCFEHDGLLVTERYLADGNHVELGENRLIINPGGVGQPRDRDPRAGYAIYDSARMLISHYRCEYDIKTTQRKMEQAELPDFLIRRLEWGV
jgi:diadenosine tetraphosphatase ApaH/serine/threonine PP2A family protein phosphatase